LTGLGISLPSVLGLKTLRGAEPRRGVTGAHPTAHRLHPPVIQSPEHHALVRKQLKTIAEQRFQAAVRGNAAPRAGSIEIPLTTVSLCSNFSANIHIAFRQKSGQFSPPTCLEVDSGASTLIVPSWEAITKIPDYQVYYTDLLGQGNPDIKEPFGCPARVVQGPIVIPLTNGDAYSIQNCVFYACTGPNPCKPNDPPTNIFGAGCLNPWATSTWNTPATLPGLVMRVPFAYDPAYPFAEFHYAPATKIYGTTKGPCVAPGSRLTLYQSPPVGYTMFDIIPNFAWMALTPVQLSINGVPTAWAQDSAGKVALIDNGGGAVLLSDLYHHVCNGACPDTVPCDTNSPDPCPRNLTGDSKNCQCSRAPIAFSLKGTRGNATYNFAIDMSSLPQPVRGLTFFVCEENHYIPDGYQGMNIGGISMLFHDMLIDYRCARVGFKPSQVV
jgi:hypothetical protein